MTSRATDAPTCSVLEDLPFCLARATLAFRRFNDQTLRAAGLPALPPGAASVLHVLAEEGQRCPVNCLVERTHLPNGTLTGLLDELEKAGYLARCANPDDGRSWLVGLTPAGLRLCAKLQKRHDLVMDVIGETFTSNEQAELARLLEKATHCMRAYRPGEKSIGAKRR